MKTELHKWDLLEWPGQKTRQGTGSLFLSSEPVRSKIMAKCPEIVARHVTVRFRIAGGGIGILRKGLKQEIEVVPGEL